VSLLQIFLVVEYPILISAIIIWASSTTKNKIHLALLQEGKGAAMGEKNWIYHLGLVAFEGNTFTVVGKQRQLPFVDGVRSGLAFRWCCASVTCSIFRKVERN